MVKKFGLACVVIFALLGVYSVFGVARQAVEDYSNFRKIVQWVAIKQQQEAAALERQRQAPKPAAPAPAAAPDAGAPSGK